MRNNGPAGLPRRETPTVSPVLTSEDGWLGDDDRNQPLTLQLRLPVSAEELAAALYDDHQLCPADLAADENVWGFAAAAIVRDGLSSVQRRVDEILLGESRGTLVHQAWLATCRRRVAEVTGASPPSPVALGVAPGLARARTLTEVASPEAV
jgi:hypothetical protein